VRRNRLPRQRGGDPQEREPLNHRPPPLGRRWPGVRRLTLVLISVVSGAFGLGVLSSEIGSGSLAHLETARLGALVTLIVMPWIALALARARSLSRRA